MEIKRNCKFCNREFTTKSWEIKRGWGKFCSNICVGLNKRNKITKICLICNNEFKARAFSVKIGHGNFCSNKCKYEGRLEWKEVKEVKKNRICLKCGTNFKAKPSVIKLGSGKYCCSPCANTGENNPAWKGGLSFEPYTTDFNKRFKLSIRQRDNYVCQLCNMFEEDHKKIYNRVLAIHHIDYNKKNTMKENCITLCQRCNVLVNKDRELWTKHFQGLLKKNYDYKYTSEQKIILDLQ